MANINETYGNIISLAEEFKLSPEVLAEICKKGKVDMARVGGMTIVNRAQAEGALAGFIAAESAKAKLRADVRAAKAEQRKLIAQQVEAFLQTKAPEEIVDLLGEIATGTGDLAVLQGKLQANYQARLALEKAALQKRLAAPAGVDLEPTAVSLADVKLKAGVVAQNLRKAETAATTAKAAEAAQLELAALRAELGALKTSGTELPSGDTLTYEANGNTRITKPDKSYSIYAGKVEIERYDTFGKRVSL